jgi:hypothetical protein
MNVLDKLLFNLQTIANIPHGRRISTSKEFIVIEPDSVMQGYWRWQRSESRDKAVLAVCREVRTTITIAGYIAESHYFYADPERELTFDTIIAHSDGRAKRVAEMKKIRLSLLAASDGVGALCITYQGDADVSGHLHPLSGEIVDCVARLTTLLIELGEYTETVGISN